MDQNSTSDRMHGSAGVYLAETPLQKTILVVDDDEAVRAGLRSVLLLQNFQVLDAGNGVDAITAFDAHCCDLVLVDMNMPMQNGWGTIASLRFRRPALPVIIITARPDQRTLARETGVELMEKPLNIPALLHRIRVLLGGPVAAVADRCGS